MGQTVGIEAGVAPKERGLPGWGGLVGGLEILLGCFGLVGLGTQSQQNPMNQGAQRWGTYNRPFSLASSSGPRSIHAYVYIYVYVCTHRHLHYIYIYIYIYMCVYQYTHIHTYACIFCLISDFESHNLTMKSMFLH